MKKGGRKSFVEHGSQRELALNLDAVASEENNTHFEEFYSKKGYRYIAGVDEAGRGPLAGPVVAAAVILPKGFYMDDISDSKKIPEKKRDSLYDHIYEEAVSVGVGIIDERKIEELNILNAAMLAMKTALDEMETKADFILVDGNVKVMTTTPQITVKKGDSRSISIAAASIIAKVTRDRIMYQYHRTYPAYNFKSHKGYGTKEHIDAIRKHGITKIHRRTFSPIKEMLDEC